MRAPFLLLALLVPAQVFAQLPGEREGASVKEDGATVVRQAEAFNFVEPDATLVTESSSGTARIDVSKYTLLAGRSGGQTINGGTGASDDLTLTANDETFSLANAGRIKPGERLVWDITSSGSAAIDAQVLDITGTVTNSGAGATGFVLRGLRFRPTFEYDGTLGLGSSPAIEATYTLRPRTSGTEIGSHIMFLAAPAYEPDLSTAVTRTAAEITAFSAEPIMRIRSGSHASAQVVVNSVDGLSAFTNGLVRAIVGHVGAQTRVVTARGLHAQAPKETGSGDVDLFVGVDIEDSTEPDASISLRSFGAKPMKHGGGAIFGSSAVTPTAMVEGEAANLGDRVECLRTTSTGDDPQEATYQGRVATTGTSATAIWTRTLATDTAAGASVNIRARCTTGSSGCTVGQVFAGTYTCAWKNVSGTTSALSAASGAQTVVEDISGTQTVTCDTVSTTDMRITVQTGAASSNITWHATVRVMELQS